MLVWGRRLCDDVGLRHQDVHHMFKLENQEVKEVIHIQPYDLNK